MRARHRDRDSRRADRRARASSATSAASSSRAGTRARFDAAGIDADFVQDNHSRSRARRAARPALPGPSSRRASSCASSPARCSTSRSTCARARRRSARSVGDDAVRATNRRMLWVPPGFAHGFLVLSEYAGVPLQDDRLLVSRARAHAALERSRARASTGRSTARRRSPRRMRPARRSRMPTLYA